MIATWYVEAGKYKVLPVDSRGTLRFADPRPQIAQARDIMKLYPDTQAVPINACPQVLNRPFSITADAEIPKGGAEGALFSAGDVQGGFAFYVQNGKLHYVYNYVGSEFYHAESNVQVPEGRHQLRLEFEVTGNPDVKNGKGAPGRGQLYIDDKLVGQVDVPLTMALSLGLGGGFVCGADSGSPVCDKYKSPFKFTGKLYSVTVDVSGDLIKDDEMAMKTIMMRQ
jgi:arylsulfatase